MVPVLGSHRTRGTGSCRDGQHFPQLVDPVAKHTRGIQTVFRGPRSDECLELGDRRDHAGELLPLLKQSVDERVHRRFVGGLREHEVERMCAERSSGHIVRFGDDPQIERLVKIRALDQRGGDPEEQVVACFVLQQIGRGGVPERDGIVETSDQHPATVAQEAGRE